MTKKMVHAVLPSYEEVQRDMREEEERWASLSGPVTVRYIQKEEANGG